MGGGPHLGTKLVGIDWQNKAMKIWVYAHSYREVKLQRFKGVDPGRTAIKKVQGARRSFGLK